MLTSIDHRIKYRKTTPLASCAADPMYEALDVVLRTYNRQGITITRIESDNEFQHFLEPLEDEWNIRMNFAPPGEHVPAAEHNNRTIADRVRTAVHYLPFKYVPRKLLRRIAMRETDKLNWFPAAGGISDVFTPNQFLGFPAKDWSKDLKILQGSYVQAYVDRPIKNDLKPRTIDALYLDTMDNEQGGHIVLNLATNEEVRTPKVTQVPFTNLVIKAVESLAIQEGMSSLKLENHSRTVIYNNDYQPGVDYEEYETPLEELRDPDYRPRKQRNLDSNVNNLDPIQQSELDGLRSDADNR